METAPPPDQPQAEVSTAPPACASPRRRTASTTSRWSPDHCSQELGEQAAVPRQEQEQDKENADPLERPGDECEPKEYLRKIMRAHSCDLATALEISRQRSQKARAKAKAKEAEQAAAAASATAVLRRREPAVSPVDRDGSALCDHNFEGTAQSHMFGDGLHPDQTTLVGGMHREHQAAALAALRDEFAALRDELGETKAAFGMQAIKTAQLEEQITELKDHNQQLQAQNQQLTARSVSQERKLEWLHKLAKKADANDDASSEKHAEAASRAAALSRHIETQRAKTERAASSVKDVHERAERFSREATLQLRELSERAAAMQSAESAMRKQVEHLQQEVQRFKVDVAVTIDDAVLRELERVCHGLAPAAYGILAKTRDV